MSKWLFAAGPVLCVVLFSACTFTGIACAGETTEEAEVWAAEDKLLEKAALEQDGFNPLERSCVGVVHLEKAGFSPQEKENVKTINVGHFVVKGRAFVLRLENADLLAMLRKAPLKKPVSMVGTVRANGKYFVASDVSLALPGRGSVAPRARKRRGGL